jgi:hypothetical protein
VILAIGQASDLSFLNPKDQIGADARGLEFVIFNERKLLKATANYNAAFDADSLTANRCGERKIMKSVVGEMAGL